jgi:predicted SprT family Zn-dependent metalloprotease
MTLARTLCNEHGLDVPLEWHNRKTSAGTTFFLAGACTKIALSRPVTALNSEEQVRDTILHEIAHARAGISAGHGPMWKAIALAIGARPEPCCTASTVQVQGRYFAVCPNCAQELNKYRRPRAGARYVCVSCKRKGITSLVEIRERE